MSNTPTAEQRYNDLLETVKTALTYRDFGVLNEYLGEGNKIPAPATPILQNQHDDDLAIEAMDFYYRHICWKLGSSHLGDIERKNYEGLAQKLKIRIQ